MNKFIVNISAMDQNNNFPPSKKSYSLRPRAERKVGEEDPPEVEATRRLTRCKKSMPLSKYRRNTANARERSRMREINEAFETLRKAIPRADPREKGEKLTKISTLKLAMRYISTLREVLQQEKDLGSDGGVHIPPPDPLEPIQGSISETLGFSYVFDDSQYLAEFS